MGVVEFGVCTQTERLPKAAAASSLAAPFRARRSAQALLVVALLATTLATTGWTWNLNTFTQQGSGSYVCGNTSNQPCVLWQQPHYTVSWTNVYLDSSLAGRGVNFSGVLTNTVWPQIYSQNNYSMNYRACYSAGCSPVLSYYGGNLGCLVYGETVYYSLSQSEYSSQNLAGAGVIGWYAFFRGEEVIFNNYWGYWNQNLTYQTGTDYCSFAADARKVAAHETGHSEGLGHTSYTAIMHQGPENFYQYQSNDISGFNDIYPGNGPSS